MSQADKPSVLEQSCLWFPHKSSSAPESPMAAHVGFPRPEFSRPRKDGRHRLPCLFVSDEDDSPPGPTQAQPGGLQRSSSGVLRPWGVSYKRPTPWECPPQQRPLTMTVLVIVSKSVRPLSSDFLDVAWLLPWFKCTWPVGSPTARGVALLERVWGRALRAPSAQAPPSWLAWDLL